MNETVNDSLCFLVTVHLTNKKTAEYRISAPDASTAASIGIGRWLQETGESNSRIRSATTRILERHVTMEHGAGWVNMYTRSNGAVQLGGIYQTAEEADAVAKPHRVRRAMLVWDVNKAPRETIHDPN